MPCKPTPNLPACNPYDRSKAVFYTIRQLHKHGLITDKERAELRHQVKIGAYVDFDFSHGRNERPEISVFMHNS